MNTTLMAVGVNPTASFKKNTCKAADAKKTPARPFKKTPARRGEKAPAYYIPSELYCLLSPAELEDLLVSFSPSQHEWCSHVRIRGLLMLLDFFNRKYSANGTSCSTELAHNYVSKLGRAKFPGTIKEPLTLLVEIGVLDEAQHAVKSWHIAASSKYRISPVYHGHRNQKIQVTLPHKLLAKLHTAAERQEKRLVAHQPFRKGLLADLNKVSIAENGRSLFAEFLRDVNMKHATSAVIAAIDGKHHRVKRSPTGQITTSLGSCPKRLKPFLRIDQQRPAFCDISHAHHCFLPRLLKDRIKYLRQENGAIINTQRQEDEVANLIEFLSHGDFYQKLCCAPNDCIEREKKKSLVTKLLNLPNHICMRYALYRSLRQQFPCVFQVIEDIKRADHRNISKQLQHYTAEAINSALIEAQKRGIVSIPEVDAIICQEQHKDTVCEIIGRKVYEISGGVTCKVGGIRYVEPAAYREDTTPIEHQKQCG